jgi:hypothetical protein
MRPRMSGGVGGGSREAFPYPDSSLFRRLVFTRPTPHALEAFSWSGCASVMSTTSLHREVDEHIPFEILDAILLAKWEWRGDIIHPRLAV